MCRRQKCLTSCLLPFSPLFLIFSFYSPFFTFFSSFFPFLFPFLLFFPFFPPFPYKLWILFPELISSPLRGAGGAKVRLYSPGKHTNKNNHLFLNSLLVPWDGWLGIQYRFFFLSKSLTWIHIKFFVKLYTYLYKIVHIQNIQHDTLNCLYEKINNKNILS